MRGLGSITADKHNWSLNDIGSALKKGTLSVEGAYKIMDSATFPTTGHMHRTLYFVGSLLADALEGAGQPFIRSFKDRTNDANISLKQSIWSDIEKDPELAHLRSENALQDEDLAGWTLTISRMTWPDHVRIDFHVTDGEYYSYFGAKRIITPTRDEMIRAIRETKAEGLATREKLLPNKSRP